MTVRIGIDFGGTKIEAAALDGEGQFLSRIRRPNPGDYDGAMAVVVDLVAQVEAEVGQRGTIGIGSPGSRSPRTGLMRNCNSQYLNGRRFLEDVQVALGREVRLANDANCLALSEAIDGAAAGRRSVFGLIIGTGCGGGLVIDGRVVEGAHGIAGEIGHMPLPWAVEDELPAPRCWCGQPGCFELWVSGTGFSRAFAAATGRTLAAPEIVATARAGDGPAAVALDRYIDRLGRGLALLATLVDPDAIVIGGGMSNVDEIYAGLPEVVRRNTFSDMWDGEIVPARWGDSSGVRGAALLWE
jgi:fructokinase